MPPKAAAQTVTRGRALWRRKTFVWWAAELEGGGVEEAVDGHGSLVARLTRHARLHRAHSHVPEREGVWKLILHKMDEQSNNLFCAKNSIMNTQIS